MDPIYIINGTHQLLAYADDINTVGENIKTIQKNKETLSDARMEVNPEKTKYMLMSHCQKAGQRHRIKIVNRSSEDVAKFTEYNTNRSKFHA
jgi:hypothetical protein